MTGLLNLPSLQPVGTGQLPVNPIVIGTGISTGTTVTPTSVGSSPTSIGTTTGSSFSGLFDLFSSRLVAIVLGLIFIIGAILLYIGDDVAGAIESGKGTVAKIGELSV